MASITGKTVNGQTYYYLREVARVDGKPKVVSQRYLGKAEDIAAAMDGATALPERTRHIKFGALAAAWGMLARLDVAGIIDQTVGARRSDAAASVGTYIALAAANRIVKPCSKRRFADWWATTAGDRWVRLPPAAWDHRRFWDAMDALSEDDLRAIERQIAQRMVKVFGLDLSALVGGHGQLRDVHRLREPQSADRSARQSQTETHRPAAGRPGPGRHPRRRDPAGVTRLPRRPARRHPVLDRDR